MGKMGHFWVQNWYLLNFLKIYSSEFCETAPDGRHQEMVLRVCFGYWRKIVIMPKSFFLNFFPNLFIRFFWNYTNDQHYNIVKATILEFEGKFKL